MAKFGGFDSKPISVAGLLRILIGAFVVVIAFWNPFDPAYCSSGCGMASRTIFNFLYWLFGHWGPRTFLIIVGAVLIVLGWRDRWSPRAIPKPAVANKEEKPSFQ